MPRKIPSLIPGALGALIVLATIFAVGRPAVFTDTRDYFIHGARFYQALRRVAFNEADAPAQPAPGQKWTRQQWVKHFNHSNMGARSPYYGVFLYTLAHHGTLWAMTAVQALCCAWLAFLLWRGMAPNAPGWTYYALMAALCAGTSLPWVAGFAVPDIFAPVTAMAIVLIALYRQGLERWEKAGVWVLLTAGILFHGSHLLLTLSLLPFVLGAAWLLKPDAGALRRTGGLILGAAAAASVLGFVYAAAIRVHTGDELRRPPFLIARVLADGPGRAYLRHSCAEGAPWVICKYKDLPLARSDDILWSAKKTLGVFNRSSYEERLAMEDQENSFVLHTIAYDPWGQLYASARNWWRQLLRCWVDDPLRRPSVFLRHNYWGRTNLVGLIRGVGDCGRSGALCEPKVTISGLAAVDEKVLLLALAGMVVALAQRKALGRLLRRDAGWDDPAGRATLAAVLLCAAVVLNAAVCGVVSGPFPRYQARIVWLLPEAAMLLGLALAPARAWAWARLPQRVAVPPAWIDTARALWGKVDPAFLRFGMVGTVGFCTDAALLHLFMNGAGLNYFNGRLASFTLAIFVTWTLNRTWTFKSKSREGRLKQAAVYFGVQVAGGAANISVYTAAIMMQPLLKHYILVPLALGSAAGLCLTFLGSKHLAFRTREQTLTAMDTGAV